jgi:putative molybdopterin biosynthesis protein
MKQRQFLTVVDRDEAERRFRAALEPLHDLGVERAQLAEALGRVLAEDVVSGLDVPGFDRANLDGWAVRAEDTFGASEQAPRRLRRAPYEVAIGRLPERALAPGEAMAVPTGGPLPRGADAVLMVEHSEIDGDAVVVRSALVPGQAVSFAGIDIARGETLYRAGDAITSREIGVLAAIGQAAVSVRRRPRVAILSTGDELVAPGEARDAGKLHDANGAMLAAAVEELGCLAIRAGIVADDEEALAAAVGEALAQADALILSGGTSKGPGDLNARVLERVLEPPGIVVHGVALKPGKPICLAASGRKPVVVLPGFPTSAIFTFHELVAPLLARWAGRELSARARATARLPRKIRSDPGRTEFTLAHLVEDDAGLVAYPIGKGSGSVTTWSHADGYFVIPRHTEQLEAGAEVEVRAIAGLPRPADLVVVGSHCLGLDVLLGALRAQGFSSKLVAVGSEAGLEAARRRACDVAPMHLYDASSDRYNTPFMTDDLTLVLGYGRLQGVVFRRGDPRFEGREAEVAVKDAIADPTVAIINRNRGSGTRALYDRLIGEARPPGYRIEASSHHAVAAAVEQGRADFGIAIDVVTRGRELGFLPLREERFDFAVPKARKERPAVKALVELLADPTIHAALAARGFLP